MHDLFLKPMRLKTIYTSKKLFFYYEFETHETQNNIYSQMS